MKLQIARFKTRFPVLTSFGPGSICTRNYGHRGEIRLFFWGEGDSQWFRCPFVNKLVDLLLDGIQWTGGRNTSGGQTFSQFSPLFARCGAEEGCEWRKVPIECRGCVAWGVLVRRLHVACDNIRPWYLIKDKLCLYESVGKKCEEGLLKRRDVSGQYVSA